MNQLSPPVFARLMELLEQGIGARECARRLQISKDTAAKYRRKWIDAQLQQAYDCMWDGDDEGADAITAKLPPKEVRAMLYAWMDDWSDDPGPKSKWH